MGDTGCCCLEEPGCGCESWQSDLQTEFIVRWRPDGTRTYVNGAYARYFGMSREDLIGSSFLPLIATEGERADLQRRLSQLTPATPVMTDVHRAMRADGDLRWQEWTDRAIFDEDGRIVELRSIGRDVHERVGAEAQLRRSRELLSIMVANTPAAVAMFDSEMRYLAWSKRWLQDYRLGDRDLTGLSHYEVFPEIGEEWKAVHRRCLAGATESCDEEAFHRADGRVDHVRWVVQPWHRTDEIVGGIILFTEVVTERRRTEESLRDSEARFRAIFDQTFQFIGLLSTDGRILEANRTALEFAGITEDEIRGVPFWETRWWMHSPALQQRLRDAVRDAAAGEFVRFEATHPGADGKLHTVDFSLKPVRDERGVVTMLIPEGRDITQRKHAEESLRTSEETRRRLEAQVAQHRRMEAIGRLAAGIAHDFNNLLTVINGSADLLLTNAREGDHGLVEGILDAGRSAASLTRQLLAFSRSQSLVPEVVRCDVLFAGVARMLERILREDIELVFDAAADTWPIRVDRAQFEQVVINLAANAQDAMPDGGRLRIVARNVEFEAPTAVPVAELAPGRYVVLTVQDNGVGMGEEDCARAFEPFFTTKRPGKGTGLGLATVHGIVEQSGGRVHVSSQLGVGTAFSLYFPAVDRAVDAAVATPQTDREPFGEGRMALVVEDDSSVRAFVANVLRTSGFVVCEAEDGGQGLRQYHENADAIALIVTDLVMPALGGWELLQQVREAGGGASVVMISGYFDGDLPAGETVLAKPFGPKELRGRVREALAR